MELKEFDAKGFKENGEGATAFVYVSDEQPDILVKVFKDGVDSFVIEGEYTMTKNAMEAGLNVPAVYDIVSFNGKPGIVYERIHNKKSLSRAIAEDQDNVEKYMKMFAENCKYLHSIKVDTNKFPSEKKIYQGYIEKAYFLDESEKNKLRKLLDSVPDEHTMIHGDLHTGNVVVSNDKFYFIDLGGLSYGNPVLDEAIMFFLFNVVCVSPQVQEIFHMSEDLMRTSFEYYLKAYYNNPSEEFLETKKKELLQFSCFFLMFAILVAGMADEEKINRLKGIISTIE